MRKGLLCLLLVGLCLLPGCRGEADGGAEKLALDIRAGLIAMTGLTGRAEVTADYGERAYSFTLDIAYDSTEGGILTVVEPELIAGLTARVQSGAVSIEYDGASLETGQLSGSGASPIEALPLILQQARSGYLAESVFETVDETETLRVTYTDAPAQAGAGTQVIVWFDKASCVPLKAEIYSDGNRVIACTFGGIEMTGWN